MPTINEKVVATAAPTGPYPWFMEMKRGMRRMLRPKLKPAVKPSILALVLGVPVPARTEA